MKFVIISPHRNNDLWTVPHFNSVIQQQYRDYKHIFIDDASTDDTNIILNQHKSTNQLVIIKNKERKGTLVNQLEALKYANDDDIIVHLDGDDWFLHPYVLSRLKSVYDNPNYLATHGDYVTTDGSKSINAPCFSNNFRGHIRQNGWSFSHLRTYRKWLFNHVKDEDLRNSKGEYFTSAPDTALFLPILELAGSDRVACIKSKLMVYNRETPHNEDKVDNMDQYLCAMEVFNKKPYTRL